VTIRFTHDDKVVCTRTAPAITFTTDLVGHGYGERFAVTMRNAETNRIIARYEHGFWNPASTNLSVSGVTIA